MNSTTLQTKADRDILGVYGHPQGPRFGTIDCIEYDEHRSTFRRINGEWHCDDCHISDYKHARYCDLIK